LGEHDAARLPDGDWQPTVWTGQTATGTPVQVQTKHYEDERWRQACEMVVLAELRQCIGRGRSILESGIPVLVLSKERLPFRIMDSDVNLVNEAESRILGAMGDSDGENGDKTLNSIIKGFVPIFAPREIAQRTGVSVDYVRVALKRLRSQGLVQHHSDPRGWSLPAKPAIEIRRLIDSDNPASSRGEAALSHHSDNHEERVA
jgi:hypothetical protein